MPTTAEVLASATARLSTGGLTEPRRDAEALWLAVTRGDRAGLFAHPEAPASVEDLQRFETLVSARLRRQPIQYLTGEWDFLGRRFAVTPAALIPRPETELVAAAAIEKANTMAVQRRLTILDAGAGSGVLAITLALELGPKARVFGCDRSSAALALARENAARLGAPVAWLRGDWLSALAERPHWDLIVSNPPYVSQAEWEQLPAEVRDYEPREALTPGPSGLEAYSGLIPQAWVRLKPEGWLILETGYRSTAALGPLLRDWRVVERRQDYQGWDRVLLARR